jgi:hypothetical protein
MDLKEIAEDFARNVAAQTDAIWNGEGGKRSGGNKYAKRYIAAFKKLRAHGEAGRDALEALITHPRMDVRVNAAVFLLSDRPLKAKPVLEEASMGKGMIPFVASQALNSWNEGTWHLDID